MTDLEHPGEKSLPEPPPGRSPVWPAFAAFGVAMGFVLAAQFVAGVCIGVWYVVAGGDPQALNTALPDLIASTPVFVTLTLASQLAFLSAAIIAGRVAPVPPRGGLGFVRSALPIWGYPVLAVGSLVPLAAGAAAWEVVSWVVPPDDTLERVFGRVTPGGAVPFALFIALVPGFVEEVFFRGYVQRRLLVRWPAWAAIATTAGLFGLMHIHPTHVASAFVAGLWLGAVACWSGSVWPAVLCHASINAASSVWNLGARFEVIPDPPPSAGVGAGIVLALGCFLASAWLLMSAAPSRLKDAGDAER